MTEWYCDGGSKNVRAREPTVRSRERGRSDLNRGAPVDDDGLALNLVRQGAGQEEDDAGYVVGLEVGVADQAALPARLEEPLLVGKVAQGAGVPSCARAGSGSDAQAAGKSTNSY